MKLSILTYNVLFNKACPGLKELLVQYKPEIICLQEFETSDQSLQFLRDTEYRLADYSNSFIKFGKIFGVATFYNPSCLKFRESFKINLPRSFIELTLKMLRHFRGGNQPRTVLKTVFASLDGAKQILVYNNHLTPFGTNTEKLKQLREALMDAENVTQPVIVTGDFNYPYSRKKLEEITASYNLKEATSNIDYTYEVNEKDTNIQYNPLLKAAIKVANLLKMTRIGIFKQIVFTKYKIDYVFYKNLALIKTKRIDTNHSDHYPIVSEFELSENSVEQTL